MLRARTVRWHEPALLAAGVIQLLSGPWLLLRLGGCCGASSDPGTWFMLAVWSLGIAVSGASIRAGRRLGWRHLLAIGPGLCAVHALPRLGAIPALFGLGAVLLMAARRKHA